MLRRPRPRSTCVLPLILAGSASILSGQSEATRYVIGEPKVRELWINPDSGKDTNNGSKPEKPLRSIYEAVRRIRLEELKRRGYRVKLMPGHYPSFVIDGVRGTAEAPVIVEAAEGPGTVIVDHRSAMFASSYVYLIGLHIRATTGKIPPLAAGEDRARHGTYHVLQIGGSDHILLRNVRIESYGDIPAKESAKEGLKVSQSRYVYLEDSEFSGAWDNSVDFVAVQYGHILGNRIHDSGDWNIYTKGGSGYLRIEDNEIYNSPVGGYLAGQETGFEYMVSPWVHWEAHNIAFVNNVIHDSAVGMGAGGGYNILLAHNTLYRVGRNGAVIQVMAGTHACNSNVAVCGKYNQAGGWGRAVASPQLDPVPARNVYVVNNLIYNPPDYGAAPLLSIAGPRPASEGTNLKGEVSVDANLQIKGNAIWLGNGAPLGIEKADSGCRASNQSCNPGQLAADNWIDRQPPNFWIDPKDGAPKFVEGNLPAFSAVALTPFPAAAPLPPQAPEGDLAPAVTKDRTGAARRQPAIPGAYLPVTRPSAN